MLYSIIIPTYNAANTINQCIESILNQTIKDYEILIFDNLSNDKTIDLIKSYKTNSIKWISEKDKGIYDAMNKGIEKASGDWLYFMGCDDYFANDSVLEEISIHLNKSSTMVYGNTILNPGGKVLQQKRNIYSIFLKNICHQAIFYNRTKIADLKYDLNYRLLADWDLNIKIFKKFLFQETYVNKNIVYYSTLGKSNDWGSSYDYKNYFMFKFELYRKYLGKYLGLIFYLIYRLSSNLNIRLKLE